MNSMLIKRWALWLCILACLFIHPLPGQGQEKDSIQKLSNQLYSRLVQSTDDSSFEVLVSVKNNKEFRLFLDSSGMTNRLIYEHPVSNTFLVSVKKTEILKKLLTLSNIIFLDEKREAREELVVGNYDLSTNRINTVHARYPAFNGSNILISVKENKMDTADIDLKGRYIPTPLASPTNATHATIMTTIAAGGGNSSFQGKGAAWGSNFSSSSFAILLPDPDNIYQQYVISVQNHSYGTGIENFYGIDARAYDASTITNPSLVHVFSAGNSGNSTSTAGPYSGVQGFANLTGSFKMAKNIITVGHIDSFGTVLAPSSKGPAYDGRVKPELVAFGEDGSSGAAALVSGTIALLQHAYKLQFNSLPSSSLIKAILLNTADDMGSPGLDFSSGYGNVNAYKAFESIMDGNFVENSISNGDVQIIPLTIPGNLKQLKITLVWNDSAAQANVAKALINDIDMELSLPASGESWKPWVLNSFPHVDSLTQLPSRKRDSLNNAEQVTIDDPVSGNYIIQLRGFNISSGSQAYSVAILQEPKDSFIWYYPFTDNIFPQSINTIRWESTFTATTGILEFTKNGSAWQVIDPAVDLATGYYKWSAPGGFGLGVLRMKIGAREFLTDTFTISSPLQLKVGFNCPDSFLLHWNRIPGITEYSVFSLGAKYLERLLITTDSLVVLGKASNPSLHYAVSARMEDQDGVKSRTINYQIQGVECYVKSFLAMIVNGAVELRFELGTVYLVKDIKWEKLSQNGFYTLARNNNVSGLLHLFIDPSPTKGVNSYRVTIVLADGREISSHIETVYFFANSEYIVYPNPVRQGQDVFILTSEIEDDVIQVFTGNGLLVYESILDDIKNSIPTGKFARGFYFIRIMRAGKTREILKFIIN